MYGLPKLIELERTRSPGYTCLVFESPSGLIFSDVEVMYRPMLGASPIFTQFSPAGSSVIYASMGRGDPPRSIRTRSENLRCSQAVIRDKKLHLGNSVSWVKSLKSILKRTGQTYHLLPLFKAAELSTVMSQTETFNLIRTVSQTIRLSIPMISSFTFAHSKGDLRRQHVVV